MNAQLLASELSQRFRSVAPHPVVVDLVGDLIVVGSREQPETRCAISISGILDQSGDPATHLHNACYSALNTLQDEIAEATTEPWPGHGAHQPMPGVAVGVDQILLWYGDSASPTLQFDPIPRRD